MYKPKHKRPMELKPNGKVVGLAASAVMLATPVLQTAGAVSAAESDDSIQTTTTSEAPSQDTVSTETTYSFAKLNTLIEQIESDIASTNGFVLPAQATLQTSLDNAKKLTSDSAPADISAEYLVLQHTYDNSYRAELSVYNFLQKIITDTNNLINTGKYTDTSVAVVKAKIAAAEKNVLNQDWSNITDGVFINAAWTAYNAIDDAADVLDLKTNETPDPETDPADLETLNESITAAKDAIEGAKDQVAEDGSIVTIADASKVSYLPSATALATALTTAQGLVTGGSTDATAIENANTGLTTQTKNYQAENTARSGLQTLISDTANSLTDSNYSDTKKENITDTLNTARDTLAKAGTSWTATDTQTASQVFLNAIQENTTAITTAVNADDTGTTTPETPTVDTSELQAMIDVVDNLDLLNGDYSETSIEKLQSAYDAAKAIIANGDASDTEVSTALNNLSDAIKGLGNAEEVETVAQAKVALNNAIVKAGTYLRSSYTAESYKTLRSAVNSGRLVYSDDTITNVQNVTDATAAIEDAIDNLVPLKYATTVQNIKDLQAKINDLRVWDYTQDSWETLVDANDNATDILNLGTNATKDQLDDAYNYLNDAFTNLKAVSENNILKQLGDLSTQVQNLNQGQFTDTSWAKLATAQKSAQEILANDNGYNASVASVQNAYDNLQAAVKGLVSVYGNSNQQTDLTNLYKKVQYYTKGSDSDDNWQAFLVARDNAATALKSDDSTVIDYMNAYDALAKAAKTLGSDADMSYIASAAYSEINGVGKVFFEGQGIVLYDKPNGQQVDDADGEGRLLADQTEWKVMRQATLQDGSSWYEVGKNEWVNAKYVMIEEAQVGQIDYLPDMAVNLWNFQPDGLHFTGRRLDNGTAWEMWGSMMINGEQYFNLGANQWVNAQYITVMA